MGRFVERAWRVWKMAVRRWAGERICVGGGEGGGG